MKLTQPMISKLALPPGKVDAIFFDDVVPGFGMRLRAGGRRSWIFQYQIGRKQRRMSLGIAPAISLADARRSAGELHAHVKLGVDPAATKREGQRRAADTVEAMLRVYLPEKKGVLKPSSYKSTERHLLVYSKPLHPLGVVQVTRRDVATLLASLASSSGGPTANRTRASLGGFFTWAMQRGLTEQNPVIGTPKPPEQARSRVLPTAELGAIWRAAGDDSHGAIIKMLILTACRASEIGSLQWPEIDFADRLIALPAERVKNGKPHLIPITGPMQAVLADVPRGQYGDHVFARGGFRSWSHLKRGVDARLAAAGVALESWRLHDLRRSTATGMGNLGTLPHVVECALNHISGFRAGVKGVYNKAPYLDERRVALDRWATHVVVAAEGSSNVVPMRA
jgi:integrase